jgi:hypothetical protein
MDLLKLLKDKADYFSTSEEHRGIASVVSHIEIAERHYEGGKSGDDYLFNDVIYRSNQAFEGALKEAYRIITGRDSTRRKPHEIEKYLEEKAVLKERVLQLFTNYRTQWRNTSTHDHTLYFSEQEAFLAIVNISAFINILLDQMLEKKAYDRTASDLKGRPTPEIPILKDKELLETAAELLKIYSVAVPGIVERAAAPGIREVELTGSLIAFINSVAVDIDVLSGFAIVTRADNRRYYADLLLQRGQEKLIIEIKKPVRGVARVLSGGTEQLLDYLTASGIAQGILYIPPTREGEELEISRLEQAIGGTVYTIMRMYPKKRLSNGNWGDPRSHPTD